MALEKEPSSSSQNSPEPRGLLYFLLFVLSLSFLSKFRTPRRKTANSPHSHDSTNYSADSSNNYLTRTIRPTETDSPPTPSECKYPKKEPKHWYQKGWKISSFLLNLGTLVAVAWYAFIAGQQRDAMNLAIEAQTRPWVGIDGPIVAKIPNPGNGINLTVKFRNYGQSPAIMGANPPFLVTFGGGHGFWCDQYKKWEVGEKQLNETGYGKYLDAIFPEKEGLTKENVHAPFVEGVNMDTFRLVLVGCITYESARKVRYRTEFTYQVIRH